MVVRSRSVIQRVDQARLDGLIGDGPSASRRGASNSPPGGQPRNDAATSTPSPDSPGPPPRSRCSSAVRARQHDLRPQRQRLGGRRPCARRCRVSPSVSLNSGDRGRSSAPGHLGSLQCWLNIGERGRQRKVAKPEDVPTFNRTRHEVQPAGTDVGVIVLVIENSRVGKVEWGS